MQQRGSASSPTNGAGCLVVPKLLESSLVNVHIKFIQFCVVLIFKLAINAPRDHLILASVPYLPNTYLILHRLGKGLAALLC